MRFPTSIVLGTLLCAHAASAQTIDTPPAGTFPSARIVFGASPAPAFFQNQGRSDPRPCDGCPERRVGRAIFQTTVINVAYGLGNLALGEETAKVTPKTWWKNMQHGWEWDNNDFEVNQFGHPYQGNNYFTAGRANGLSYWESSALTAFGSATWEYFGETNDPSLNDFINTTLGGIALGETFHRAAWLIRDTHATGKNRLFREIFATVLDPITGANRFISGDAVRVSEKPAYAVPTSLGSASRAGVIWHRGGEADVEDWTADPFLELDLRYGDTNSNRSREPYDAFNVRLGFGGGHAISDVQVRGRLLGQPLGDRFELLVSQGYEYTNNDAYRFGAQSAETNLIYVGHPTAAMTLRLIGWGGVTVLGAVDSVPPTVAVPVAATSTAATENGEDDEPTGRTYDYGPGVNAGGALQLDRNNHRLVSVLYELHHLHVIDGVRGNHLLQRLRADLNVPLRGRLGVGVSGDFFDRRTYYQDAQFPDANSQFPQIRVFLSWSVP